MSAGIGIGGFVSDTRRGVPGAGNTNPTAPAGEVTLRYRHTQAGSEPCHMGISHTRSAPGVGSYYFSRCYWNYTRLLMPAVNTPGAVNLPDVPPEYYGDHPAWPGGRGREAQALPTPWRRC